MQCSFFSLNMQLHAYEFTYFKYFIRNEMHSIIYLPLVMASPAAVSGLDMCRWLVTCIWTETTERSGLSHSWAPSEHTFFTMNWIWIILCGCTIEEADGALELSACWVPNFGRDPQPAGDFVKPFFLQPQGSVVRRHIFNDFFPIDLPEHTDMVWVESTGHTN